jgi:tetratricopeptide (TPR) repeat protein
MTQEELAERSGLSARAIGKLEQGGSDRPRRRTLDLLADGLGLGPDERAAFIEHYRHGAGRSPEGAPTGVSMGVPMQLPPRPAPFIGRSAEVEVVRAALCGEPGAPVLITGMGGIGKTALAVEACAAVVDGWPDGQLYAELAEPAGTARDPAAVLAAFLRSMGVPARDVPVALADRTALWRSVTHSRRLLLVLDNAVTEDQVRPLLIGAGVVVTSRGTLGGLDCTARLRLGPLDEPAARQILLTTGCRPDTESEHVTRLVRACAGVPLALRLLSARLSIASHLPLAMVVERLENDGNRLDQLSAGDRSVRGSLTGSVRLLGAPAQRALAALAHLRVPTFADWLVAAVTGGLPEAGVDTVAELVGLGLVEPAPTVAGAPRYRLHDLVSAFVRETDPPVDAGTLERAIGYAVQLTRAIVSAAIARPVPHVFWAGLPEPVTAAETAAVAAAGRDWIDAEWATLSALTDAAAQAGRARLAGALLGALRQPMTRAGLVEPLMALADRCADRAGVDRLARACAILTRAAGDAEFGRYHSAAAALTSIMADLDGADDCTRAGAWYELGYVHQQREQPEAACAAYLRSIELHRLIGNRYGELGGHLALLELDLPGRPDDHEPALAAIRLAEELGDYRTLSKTLHVAARSGLRRGHPEALEQAVRAVELAEHNGDDELAARGLIINAAAERLHGRPAYAAALAERAADRFRRLNRATDLADALTELGHGYAAIGSTRRAVSAWRQALAIRMNLNQPVQVRELCELLRAENALERGAIAARRSP